jgi:hypothetical protein
MTDAPTAHRDLIFMQAFLDLAIPPSTDGKMPGAGSLDIAAEVAGALEADELLGPFIQAGLQAVHGAALGRDPAGFSGLSPHARVELVESQLAAHPFLMPGLALHLYPSYYQHPRVLEALGEPPRPPFPEGYDVEPTDPRLLDQLRTRKRGA